VTVGLTLNAGHKLRVLRRIFGPKVRGGGDRNEDKTV